MKRSISERHRTDRPGQVRQADVFCPLAGRWLARTREMEVRGNRTFYDVAQVAGLVPQASDFNDEAGRSGWALPDQLLEVVTLCEFCEAHWLGANKVEAIHRLADVDRVMLLQELSPPAERYSQVEKAAQQALQADEARMELEWCMERGLSPRAYRHRRGWQQSARLAA